MSVLVPSSHLDLLTRPLHVALTTIMPNGSPQMSVVWRLWEDPYILISSPKTSQKTRNLTLNPRLAMLMIDPENSYRYLEMRGLIEAIEPDPQHIFLDRITQHYLGKPYYGNAEPLENKGKTEHVYFKIRPTRINVIDYPKLA